MDTQAADFTPVRFSTYDLLERDRVPAWREFFGRLVFRSEIEPGPDTPFHADVTVRNLPGLFLVSSVFSPGRLSRTPALLADGNDDVSLFVSTSSGTTAQRGREIAFSAGEHRVVAEVTDRDALSHVAPCRPSRHDVGSAMDRLGRPPCAESRRCDQ